MFVCLRGNQRLHPPFFTEGGARSFAEVEGFLLGDAVEVMDLKALVFSVFTTTCPSGTSVGYAQSLAGSSWSIIKTGWGSPESRERLFGPD